ncbi:alpha/beta fold hydrolase [Streptosporangium sp. NPDC049376]|uniref:alpha/beta fold hydrolase n=1 Tax=Streptosporangium sp. NPDC049376 TaxID=3366192 RepID=UPI00378D0B9C
MTLNTLEWGDGDRTAVLIHGMMGDSRSWWEVGPALAERGYHVVAVDLPGHGKSERNPDGDIEWFAASVLESVPPRPAFAMGHSLGGSVLAAAVSRLRPERVVYVETPFGPGRAHLDVAAFAAGLEESKSARTVESLRRERPWWSERDIEVEADAAKLFDVATTVSLHARRVGGPDNTPPLVAPSLMIRAEPSQYISQEAADHLRARGFAVRSVTEAGHSVWYGRHEEFMATLDGWV